MDRKKYGLIYKLYLAVSSRDERYKEHCLGEMNPDKRILLIGGASAGGPPSYTGIFGIWTNVLTYTVAAMRRGYAPVVDIAHETHLAGGGRSLVAVV